jgi:hypothetical protein
MNLFPSTFTQACFSAGWEAHAAMITAIHAIKIVLLIVIGG